MTGAPAPRPTALAIAFATGGMLTLMVLFNGQMGAAVTPFFASLAAHGTGTVAAGAVLILIALRRPAPDVAAPRVPAPWWSYLAGLSGAVTVMLTSFTVNTGLALSGTLALGLAGQVVFGLVADAFGLFGMPRRWPGRRDLAALGLICSGSLIIIFLGGAA